jgi:predicted DsbA family dithiol-disulfide isomerase
LYNAIQEILQTPPSPSSTGADSSSTGDGTTTEPEGRRIDGFAIVRIPYLLEPDYDTKKIYVETNRQRLIQKWGGKRQWEIQKQRHRLKERGMEVGIPHFNLDRYASNTINSHRVIQYISRTYGLYISEYVYDTLNQYHFVEGYALNDLPRLAKTIALCLQELHTTNPTAFTMMDHPHHYNHHSTGSSEGSTIQLKPPTEEFLLDYLNGTDGRLEILQTVEMLHDFGVNGIPTFIMEAGETVLNGAVHAKEFVQVFRTIEQRGYLMHNTPMFHSLLNIPSYMIQRGSYLRHSNLR